MPIFEYQCCSCGEKFEKLVRRVEDAGEAGCPSCGEHHLEQQYSTFAARAGSSQTSSDAPSCPGGMCRTPGICGRN
jgi:putative FmdB family regulatory protein